MKYIALLLLLIPLSLFGQVESQFNGTLNIFSGYRIGSTNTFTISGIFSSTTSQYTSSQVDTGDVIQVLSGSQFYWFHVYSIASSSGGVITCNVRDSTSTRTVAPSGIVNLFRPTLNLRLPLQADGISNAAKSSVFNTLALRVDEIQTSVANSTNCEQILTKNNHGFRKWTPIYWTGSTYVRPPYDSLVPDYIVVDSLTANTFTVANCGTYATTLANGLYWFTSASPGYSLTADTTKVPLFQALNGKLILNPIVGFNLMSGGGAGDVTRDELADSTAAIRADFPSGSGITDLTGDVTASGTGSVTATIANNAITSEKVASQTLDSTDLKNRGTTLLKLAQSGATNGQVPKYNSTTGNWESGIDGNDKPPYPDEVAWSTIYDKKTWTDLADFETVDNDITLSLSGGKVNIVATTIEYNWVRVLPARTTGLSRWKITSQYKVTAWGASSFYFGIGNKSLVLDFGLQGFSRTTSAGDGNSWVAAEGGSIYISNQPTTTKSLNDVIEVTAELRDTQFIYTYKNVTTGSATYTFTYTLPSSQAVIPPSLSNWGFMCSGTGGVIQLQSYKIESAETKNPNLLIVGNSKTKVGYAANWTGRFVKQLNATYPTTIYNAGSAETTSNMITKLNELKETNPRQVILADVGSNDIRAGSTVIDVMARIKILVDAFAIGGTDVYLCVFPEDSLAGGVGLGALKNAIVAAYPSNYINTWDSLSTSNMLDNIYDRGDGVHLNQAAMDKITATIIASGKIKVLDTTNEEIVTAQPPLILTGRSISSGYTFNPKRNFLFKSDATINNFVGSNVWDNGTNIVLSTKSTPTPPLTSILFHVEGAMSTYGTSSSIFMYDRQVPSSFFSFLPNNNVFSFINNSTYLWTMDVSGRFSLGRTEGQQPIRSVFEIRKGQTFNVAQSTRGVAFAIDTLTFTLSNSGVVGLSEGSVASIARETITASVAGAVYTNYSSLILEGEPIAGTNMTITNPWTLYAKRGRSYFGGGITFGAGTATAGTAPDKRTAGTNTTTPEAGAFGEYDGTEFYATNSTASRTILARVLKGSGTLDFANTAAGAVTDLTITVTGAADGDVVSLSVPNASQTTTGSFSAWVSATNTVTVRYRIAALVGSEDPASGVFKVTVTK